ncbi:hypothetical protein DFQ29_001387, partial [Apophysomyces sp. BC1021]
MPKYDTEQLKTLQQDLKNTRSVLQEFRTLYEQEYKDKPSDASTVSKGLGKKHSAPTATHTTSRLSYRDIPAFQVTGTLVWRPGKEVFDSVEHFLRTFQKVLIAFDVNLDANWEKWLSLSLRDDHDAWFESRLANKNLTWAQAHKLFVQRFESPDRMIMMASKAYSMVMGKNETVLEYSTRFQKTYREGGILDNEGLALRFLVSLLPHIRENVQVTWHGRHGKELPKNVDEILEVALAISVQKRAHQHLQDEAPTRPAQRQRIERSSSSVHCSGSSQKQNAIGCAYHGPKAHHSTAECRKNTAAPTTPPTKTENNCTYCSCTYTPGHRCQEYQDAKARKNKQHFPAPLHVNAVTRTSPPANHPADDAVEDLAESMDELEFEATRTYHHQTKRLFGQSTSPRQNPYSLYTPIILQDEHMEGLVDTGSELSAISLEWLMNNKKSWEIIPVKGQIQFAGHGHDTTRIGVTNPLKIQYNNRTITHSFEVMKLHKGTDLLLGFDIMPKLGIALTGVAIKWDDQEHKPNTTTLTDIPEPNDSPAGTPETHANFLKAIQPFINANASIPKTSFCTVPESIVRLPTTEGASTYQRQYPIPFKLQHVVDEAVANWLADCTI